MNAVFKSDIQSFVLSETCFINRVSTNTECETHYHEYIELVYSFGGKCVQYIDGKRYLAERGDLILINYGSTHALYPKDHAEYADIMFKPELINENLLGARDIFALLETREFKEFSSLRLENVHHYRFFGKERDRVEELLNIALSEERNEERGNLTVVRSVITMLLCMLFRKMNRDGKEESSERFTVDSALLEYLEANCQKRLRAKDIAQMCFYSAEHFSRVFKEYAGVSFTEFLNEARMERARMLLLQTDQSVELIYSKCGFSNRTKFFESFAKKYGTSPLKYRKISRNDTF